MALEVSNFDTEAQPLLGIPPNLCCRKTWLKQLNKQARIEGRRCEEAWWFFVLYGFMTGLLWWVRFTTLSTSRFKTKSLLSA